MKIDGYNFFRNFGLNIKIINTLIIKPKKNVVDALMNKRNKKKVINNCKKIFFLVENLFKNKRKQPTEIIPK
ncbi:hypothetical protein [Candidatus Pelagibacter sp. HIMB1542]|uniref:hypothetical protein n=1 Tax=Candidatus Pelagibacter sp. HIMB1542 TaxID=3413346 RepID=UPI003F830C12